jgi:hypothetical protein
MLIFEKKQASTHEKMRSMNKLKKQKKKKMPIKKRQGHRRNNCRPPPLSLY